MQRFIIPPQRFAPSGKLEHQNLKIQSTDYMKDMKDETYSLKDETSGISFSDIHLA